jgi:hypothetical protein
MAENAMDRLWKAAGVLPPTDEDKKAFRQWLSRTYTSDPLLLARYSQVPYESNEYYKFWWNNVRGKSQDFSKQYPTVEATQLPANWQPANGENPSTTGIKPTEPYVKNISGYDYLVTPAPEGSGLSDTYEFIGKHNEGMSPYQQAQVDIENRQWNTQQAQTGTNWLQGQETNRRLANVENYNREAQALNNLGINTESDIRNSERVKMASQYDEWRNRLMSELQSSPRSWIQYQELKNKPNPYQATPMSQGEESQNTEKQLKLVQQQKEAVLKDAQKEVDNARASWSAVADRVTDAYDIIPPDAVIQAKSRYDNAVNQLNAVESSLSGKLAGQQSQWEADKSVPGTEAYWATPRSTGEVGSGEMSVGEPASRQEPPKIPTPAWMAQYLSNPTPYLTKQELAPLSGQSLVNITPTNLEQLKGFTDWTGQNTSDWLQQTQLQLPQNLNLGGRWQPTRQR